MENNKLKLSIKTLQNIFSDTNEPEWYLNTRKLALYKSYTLPFPKLESMNLENWNLFNVDFSKLRIVENTINIEEILEKYNVNRDDFVVIQKNNTLVYVNIPEKYENKVKIKNIFSAMNDGHIKDSFMSVVENYINNIEKDSEPFNIVTEVVAHDGAKINYSSITNQPGAKRGTILRRGLTYRDALINWNVAAMDEANVYHDNTTHILGDGSEANLKIVTLGVKEQKTYFNSEVVNQGLNSKGDILQHGVLLDRSHIVFNGIGFIVKGATGSNAYQSSRMLTLSSDAKADANPMLLIDENDVMAGHGASLGRIDEEQLYYLQSRGLTRKESSRLLVHGFLSPVITELTVDKIKDLVTILIDEKINNNESE